MLVLLGIISPQRTLTGGDGPSSSPSPAATGKLYVTSGTQNAILRFDNALTAASNLPPAATISGAALA